MRKGINRLLKWLVVGVAACLGIAFCSCAKEENNDSSSDIRYL